MLVVIIICCFYCYIQYHNKYNKINLIIRLVLRLHVLKNDISKLLTYFVVACILYIDHKT